MSAVQVIVSLLSPFLALFLFYLKYRRDRWTSRIDWFSSTVEKAAEIGIEHWIISINNIDNVRMREVRIIGIQNKLIGIFSTIKDKLDISDAKEIEGLLYNFIDALTGGEFQTKNFAPDNERARNIQDISSNLYVKLSIAQDKAINSLSLFPRKYNATEF